MRGTSVKGTPYISKSSSEGGNAGKPAGYTGTVGPLYGRDIIDTRKQGGTPYQSTNGNPATTRRVVSADTYGRVMSGSAGQMNDPLSNGNGVVLDSVSSDYEDPTISPSMDSPVPGNAPMFQTSNLLTITQMRMGSNMSPAHAKDDLVALGGVMSRGLDTISKPGESEMELTTDDTLPGVAPRR